MPKLYGQPGGRCTHVWSLQCKEQCISDELLSKSGRVAKVLKLATGEKKIGNHFKDVGDLSTNMDKEKRLRVIPKKYYSNKAFIVEPTR